MMKQEFLIWSCGRRDDERLPDMRAVALILLVVVVSLAACGGRANVQCEQDANCDLNGGGVCALASTGGRWCSYPDTDCPSGYRYSNHQVADGISGICVPDTSIPPNADAGVDGVSIDVAVGVDASVDASVDGSSIDSGPTSPQIVSCTQLPATCRGSDDCCSSPLVTHGTYYRAYDVAGDSNSGAATAPATVSDFHLDKYEITVGRFRNFVNAGFGTKTRPPTVGAGEHPHFAGSGWQAAWNDFLQVDTAALTTALKCSQVSTTYNAWTDTPGANENRSINCLSWYEAMAFCIWDGGYLPSEAEWNYAASGGDEQRAYPWSAPAASLTLDKMHAIYYDGSLCGGQSGPLCPGPVDVGTVPLGDGRFGHADIAGNLSEFMLDADGAFTTPCIDCVSVKAGDYFHSLRGGSAGERAPFLRNAKRAFVAPQVRNSSVGARCARPL